MKTDIFKDLVPLLVMNEEGLQELAKNIVRENQGETSRIVLLSLFDKISQLSVKIMKEYKNERV